MYILDSNSLFQALIYSNVKCDACRKNGAGRTRKNPTMRIWKRNLGMNSKYNNCLELMRKTGCSAIEIFFFWYFHGAHLIIFVHTLLFASSCTSLKFVFLLFFDIFFSIDYVLLYAKKNEHRFHIEINRKGENQLFVFNRIRSYGYIKIQ